MRLRRDAAEIEISCSRLPATTNSSSATTSAHLTANSTAFALASSACACNIDNAVQFLERGDLDVPQCADFLLHISLVVFITIMIVSCVYVCRKPGRRRIKLMSVEVQTDDNVEIYLKDNHTSSSPTSSPPLDLDRHKLKRPLSEIHHPRLIRQISDKNCIPPSPLATSDLTTSVNSITSAASSQQRNQKKMLKKSTTLVAFPSNTLQNLITSDSYKKLASNSTISGPPGYAYKYTYKPISAVFSTSDSNLSDKSPKKPTSRFETRPVD